MLLARSAVQPAGHERASPCRQTSGAVVSRNSGKQESLVDSARAECGGQRSRSEAGSQGRPFALGHDHGG